jgi:Fic family protein
VTFAALSRWIHGHAKPHPNRILSIEKLYKVKVAFPALTEEALRPLIHKAEKCKLSELWAKISANEALRDDLILEQTYNSTTIEGTTFTKRETEAVLFSRVTIPRKSLVEHLEVTNYAAVLRNILEKKIVLPLTESLIKSLHQRLMQGIKRDAGEYSQYHRGIRGVNITLTHPADIPEEMRELIRSWNRAKRKTIREIAAFHVHFELIHPFGDGNGRLGRLLMTLQCLEQDYPPIIIEYARKADYYETLEHAQRENENPFIAFLIGELEKTWGVLGKYLKMK